MIPNMTTFSFSFMLLIFCIILFCQHKVQRVKYICHYSNFHHHSLNLNYLNLSFNLLLNFFFYISFRFLLHEFIGLFHTLTFWLLLMPNSTLSISYTFRHVSLCSFLKFSYLSWIYFSFNSEFLIFLIRILFHIFLEKTSTFFNVRTS